LYAFGSVTRDALKPESDVDFVVDIQNDNPVSYSEDYFALKFQLEVLFKRAIDLLEEKAIKNPYLLESLNKTKVLVYGKRY
jgi:predicted nucleotidyltransferase